MSIAISEDHVALAETVADFLKRHKALEASRALLEAADESNAAFYGEAAALGWLGLHIPEQYGGSGYGMDEVVVVVEQLGAGLAPGMFVPSIIAGAVIGAAGSDALKAAWLPGLADGTTLGAGALGGSVELRDGHLHGSVNIIGGANANVLVVGTGNDIAVVDATASGITVSSPVNIDPTRRTARVTFSATPATVIEGARQQLTDIGRTVFSAEAIGVSSATTTMAADYARVREQFGRPIAMYQAVKHHCANMAVASELATAAVWDAARASADGGEQFSITAAMAGALAGPAADQCAQLNTQVHGGIGFTWEHDAHVYLRRATALRAALDSERAAVDTVDLTRTGVRRARTVDLPPEAEPMRDAVRAFVAEVKDLDAVGQRTKMIEQGYAMPHWPKPWGRAAGAIEQLVIEQEFAAAGVKRPQYGITGWVILTLIQHATDDQVSRWVLPALRQDLIWCQLFSEPDAGSDAAGVKTKATRVDGGWLVTGQKVWTSGAHLAAHGFATVRTNPDLPKHQGITTMVIDMHAPGVEVRPLRMPLGNSEFNEVFFNEVFVPDDDVVGPIDGGWTVARATLGNESVSIGGGGGGMSIGGEALIPGFDANPERTPGGAGRIGRYIANHQAMGALNLRSANRAVAGAEPGPEGAMTKLVLSEVGHEAALILSAQAGEDGAFLDGAGAMGGTLILMNRAMSIAGGTSEIKRNQIGERILGLPRDPLLK